MAGPLSPEALAAYYGDGTGGAAPGGIQIAPIGTPPPDPMTLGPAAAYYAGVPAAPPPPPAAPPPAPPPSPPAPPPSPEKLSASDFAVGAAPIAPSTVTLPFSGPTASVGTSGGLAHAGERATPIRATVTEGAATQRPPTPEAPKPAAPKPAGVAGGGGGGGDPFGVAGAQKRVLGTYGSEEKLGRDIGHIEAQQALVRAEGKSQMSREQAEDAAVEQETARVRRESFERDMASVNEQLDAVRSKKVDPLAYEREHGGPAVTIIGGLIGGLYQGLNRLDKNPFLERLDRKAEEWVAMQERAIGREERGLTEKSNLLQQLRAVYKDEDMARQAARAMYYEAVGRQIEAKAGEYDSPAILARAELGANAVQRKAGEIDLAIREKAQARAQAAATAAAAQAHNRLKEEREWELKKYDAATKRMEAEGKAGEKVDKTNQRFVATGQDEHGPIGYLARNPEAAGKAEASRQARTELRGLVDRAKAIRSDQGTLGRTLNRSNPNDLIQIYKPEWETKLDFLSAEITAAKNKAGGLGALDNGTLQLLDKVVGDLKSRGGESDVRLDELLARLEAQDQAEQSNAAGARARKVISPDGSEHIEVIGGAAAPANKKDVRREAP